MMTVARCIVAGTLFAGTMAPAQMQPLQRYPLDGESVARALHAEGLDVQASQVRISTPVSAAVESPVLELFGADRMPDGHVRMRLRCHKAGDCVAFSVTIDPAGAHSPATSGSVTAALESRHAVDSTPNETQVASTSLHSAEPAIHMAPASVAVPSALNLRPRLIAAPAFFPVGAKLTMLMEDGHMHIHLPVIALDSSAAGSEVRVCTPDRKRTFRAMVMDSSTVRGIVE